MLCGIALYIEPYGETQNMYVASVGSARNYFDTFLSVHRNKMQNNGKVVSKGARMTGVKRHFSAKQYRLICDTCHRCML